LRCSRCTDASLQGIIKGYVIHKTRRLVLARGEALGFPPLGSVR
jgi:hypothetical protein